MFSNAAIATGASVVSVLLFFFGMWTMSRPGYGAKRLQQFKTGPRNLEELELTQPFTVRVVKPIVGLVSKFIVRRTPQASLEEIRHRLELAGNPNGLQVVDFMGIKGLFAVIVGAVCMVLMCRAGSPVLAMLMSAAIGAISFFLPDYWLKSRIGARKKALTKALPDALDLLTVSVEAGMGFDGAIQKVADKWDNLLTREFRRLIAEMRVGKSRRDALKDMVVRTDVPDINTFVGAIIQADQLGVSISRVLTVQAEQMRVRRRQRAQEAAQKAPVKMIFAMVFLVFPALYVVILGPAIPSILKVFN